MSTTQTATRDGEGAAPAVIAKGVEWLAEATKPLIAGLGTAPFTPFSPFSPFSPPDGLTLMDLVDRSFDYAAQIIDLQRDMAMVMLGMLQPPEVKAAPTTRAGASGATP